MISYIYVMYFGHIRPLLTILLEDLPPSMAIRVSVFHEPSTCTCAFQTVNSWYMYLSVCDPCRATQSTYPWTNELISPRKSLQQGLLGVHKQLQQEELFYTNSFLSSGNPLNLGMSIMEHLCRPKDQVGCISSGVIHLAFFSQELLQSWASQNRLDWLANEPKGPMFSALGLQSQFTNTNFLCGFRGQIQVLLLARQELYELSHLPSFWIPFYEELRVL